MKIILVYTVQSVPILVEPLFLLDSKLTLFKVNRNEKKIGKTDFF